MLFFHCFFLIFLSQLHDCQDVASLSHFEQHGSSLLRHASKRVVHLRWSHYRPGSCVADCVDSCRSAEACHPSRLQIASRHCHLHKHFIVDLFGNSNGLFCKRQEKDCTLSFFVFSKFVTEFLCLSLQGLLVLAGLVLAFRVRSIARKILWKEPLWITYTVSLKQKVENLFHCLKNPFLFSFRPSFSFLPPFVGVF